MFSTFPSNYLGEQKNFFLFARNLINTMDMINTTPTESNLSGLNQKDFQKDINNKKTDLFILKNAQGMEVAVTKLRLCNTFHHGTRQKWQICQMLY